jgi:hypothetical protein
MPPKSQTSHVVSDEMDYHTMTDEVLRAAVHRKLLEGVIVFTLSISGKRCAAPASGQQVAGRDAAKSFSRLAAQLGDEFADSVAQFQFGPSITKIGTQAGSP